MYFHFTAVALVVLATLSGINGATNITAQYCAVCADHTMCKYTGVGKTCAPRISGDVPTATEQAVILDVHNAERNKVAMGSETRGKPGSQPQAANMVKLVWNAEIATIAQRLADQCIFAHDTCRKQLSNSSVGQNIFMSMSSSPTATTSNWAAAVTAWINEVALFDKSNVSPFKFSSPTGHYTQAVWATTTSVGCGRTVFKDSTSTYTKQLYVCNYAPAGNMIGGAMYIPGAACSKCPGGRKCDIAPYKGLCTY